MYWRSSLSLTLKLLSPSLTDSLSLCLFVSPAPQGCTVHTPTPPHMRSARCAHAHSPLRSRCVCQKRKVRWVKLRWRRLEMSRAKLEEKVTVREERPEGSVREVVIGHIKVGDLFHDFARSGSLHIDLAKRIYKLRRHIRYPTYWKGHYLCKRRRDVMDPNVCIWGCVTLHPCVHMPIHGISSHNHILFLWK